MIELEHSPLGGSAAHRFINCSFSFLKQREEIEEGSFENVPSEFAELGTGAHELGALCLTEDTEPFEYIGEDFNGYKVGWPDGIALDAVQVYTNECRKILTDVAAPYRALVEQTIKRPDIHPLFKGTVDFGVISPTRLVLRDYKNGEGIGVEAPNNEQLLYYGALLILEAGFTKSEHRDIPVDIGIVQPNFYGIYEDVVPWVTTVGYVLDWLHNKLLPTMRRLYEAPRETPTEADASPGDHCQFCPVLLSCPVMQRAFETYTNVGEDFVTMLSNEELDHYYSQREYARRFMKVLEQTVKARKLTGANIPSAKLVEPQTARVWKPGGVAAIQAAFGAQAFKPVEPLSPAGIEKMSSRGKELALEWGYKPESAGLTIAPLSDRRPEAKPKGNATVFEQHAKQALEDF